MASQVKFNAFGLKKAKDQEDGQSSYLDINLGYFCGIIFSILMAPNEDILDISKGHDDGNCFGVPNLVKMFFTTTLILRVNV